MSRPATFVVALLLALFQSLGVAGATGASCGPVLSSCAQRPCCRARGAAPAEPQLRIAMTCCRAGTVAQIPVPVATTREDKTAAALPAGPAATAELLAVTVERFVGARPVTRPPHIPIFLRNRSLLL